MRRDYRRWYSPHLHRDMELLVFGHAGARTLMFPTRDGRFYEYEDLGVVASLADKIAAGQLQLYCIEGLARESFYDVRRSPAERIRRHGALEAYVLEEVMPLMDHLNPAGSTLVAGCSLGAFQAASLAFRHPHRFAKLAAFSGRYDLTRPVEEFVDLLGGHFDDDVYFHMPSQYLPGLTDEWHLRHLRRMDIVFVVGMEDPFLADNRYVSELLWAKGIPNRLEIWEGRAHRGHAWRSMAEIYI